MGNTNTSTRPAILVTNDDGIKSFFLQELVAALHKKFTVYVCAPDTEKSWIGRAITRHRNVTVQADDSFPCPAWSITGTPTDCVNIGLEHYLKDKNIAAVVSGINVGYNVTTPLILGSGTVGGAIEGAAHHIPAFAGSMALPPERFEELKNNHGKLSGDDLASLQLACEHFSTMVEQLLQRSPVDQNAEWLVHNFNYPAGMDKSATLIDTAPLTYSLGSLYSKVDNPNGVDEFTFTFPLPPEELPSESFGKPTDLSTIKTGNISYSQLRFTRVGQP